jgi:ribonuclease D
MSTGVDKLLRKLFADKEIVFLAHNAKFEYMVLYKHFGIYVKNFKDTFLASKLITQQVLKYLKGIMVWPV